MPSEPQDAPVHRKRGWIATVVTLLVLVLLGLFVARVVYFADLIRSGDLSAQSFSFTDKLTTNDILSRLPVEDGIYDLETSDDPSIGSAEAAVTIVEFADFECPFSRDSSFILRELATVYADNIYYIYRDFPLTDLHAMAQKAAEAGECAQDQGKFWEYHDKMYQNQTSLNEESLVAFAQSLNMNVTEFESCLDSGRYAEEVLDDYEAGLASGVRGTPTFFINGNRIAGSIPRDILEAIIQSILNREE